MTLLLTAFLHMLKSSTHHDGFLKKKPTVRAACFAESAGDLCRIDVPKLRFSL